MGSVLLEEYDYIVVGGGVSGCVVAGRLHEYSPPASILLVEAGRHPTKPLSPDEQRKTFNGHRSEFAERLETVPQRGLNMNKVQFDQPRVLSGGGVINGGGWFRPSRADCQTWADLLEDQSWSYDSLLPYFKRCERCINPQDPQAHGDQGPMPILFTDRPEKKPNFRLRGLLKEAYEQMGMQFHVDVNNGEYLGYGGSYTVADEKGEQVLPYHAYQCEGVSTLTECPASRVQITNVTGQARATGVECVDGRIFKATKEVIVTAGALNTPKLLLLSGIGDPQELKKHHIPINVDLPEVGQNFCDHLDFRQLHCLKDKDKGYAVGSPAFDPGAGGVPKGKPVNFVAFEQFPSSMVSSALDADGIPTTDLAGRSILTPGRCHVESLVTYLGNPTLTMKPYYKHVPAAFQPDGSLVTSRTILNTPTSRGSIRLASSDTMAPPLIDPNYYSTHTDQVILREGVRRMAHLLYATQSGRSFASHEVCPSQAPSSADPRSNNAKYVSLTPDATDDEIDARIKLMPHCMWHPMGSCSMGKVVDKQFRVIGCDGLRVADESIFPAPVGTHPQCMLYAVAERAAEMIAGKTGG